MAITEPTTEQIKEFWEWCGFKRKVMKLPSGSGMGQKCQGCSESSSMKDCGNCKDREWADTHVHYYHEERWNYPNSGGQKIYVPAYCLPLIDLNNLFKYAVPKLTVSLDRIEFLSRSDGWICVVRGFAYQHRKFYYEDPALALFWAIWEAMQDNKAFNSTTNSAPSEPGEVLETESVE